MTPNAEPIRLRRTDLDLWVRAGRSGRSRALVLRTPRAFALKGGADATSAALWPLSVDGLLVLATVGLLKVGNQTSRRVRVAVWSSFLLGIAVSLAANIAAAPMLAWQPVLVAGWPPVALLLAVELLAHRPRAREQAETQPAALVVGRDSETDSENGTAGTLPEVSHTGRPPAEQSAEEIMWAHFRREQARGRVPTGAELDRVAGTNNYGRRVLRQWRTQGRIQPPERGQLNGHRFVVTTGA